MTTRGTTTEARLDRLRDQARRTGAVEGAAAPVKGGPIPAMPLTAEAPALGYYGLPLLKPPVWQWMIPVYFFVGGLAGMSALIAAAALLRRDPPLVRAAMWPAAVGAALSAVLLVLDLGRPQRFLHMLRVFKPQSPMSLGSWLLSGFGAAAVPGLALTLWDAAGAPPVVHALAVAAVIVAAALGVFLACYTGALIAVTAIPAWHLHRAVLPFTFGVAGLGSAAGLLELAGHRVRPLHAIGYASAISETLVMLWLALRRHGDADRALHQGSPGWTLRAGEFLQGPLPLVLRALGMVPAAAASFLVGALASRFGWISAGRRSAEDPRAAFADQGAARAQS